MQGQADQNEPEQPNQCPTTARFRASATPAARPKPGRATIGSTPRSPPRKDRCRILFPPGGFTCTPGLTSPPLPTPPSDDRDWVTPDRADKQALQLPPIDLDAESLTMSMQRPTT
jgi:hypothetical protein